MLSQNKTHTLQCVLCGAGDGNRTHVNRLETCHSTIELRPRGRGDSTRT